MREEKRLVPHIPICLSHFLKVTNDSRQQMITAAPFCRKMVPLVASWLNNNVIILKNNFQTYKEMICAQNFINSYIFQCNFWCSAGMT